MDFMAYTNAKHKQHNPNQQALEYYILITGNDEVAMGFQWSENHPHKWMVGKDWVRPMTVNHKGVVFHVLDYLPLKPIAWYAMAMDSVMSREGLIFE